MVNSLVVSNCSSCCFVSLTVVVVVETKINFSHGTQRTRSKDTIGGYSLSSRVDDSLRLQFVHESMGELDRQYGTRLCQMQLMQTCIATNGTI